MYTNNLKAFVEKYCPVKKIQGIASRFTVYAHDCTELFIEIPPQSIVFLDFETDKLKAKEILCFSLLFGNEIHWFNVRELPLQSVAEFFKQSILPKCKYLVAHNMKFEFFVMRRLLGLPLKVMPKFRDTMTLYHLFEEKRPSYSLKHIGCDVFGFSDWSAGVDQSDMKKVDVADLFVYNVIDVFVSYLIYEFVNGQIANDFLRDLASSISIILEEMEHYGMKIDTYRVQEETVKYRAELERIRNKLNKMESIRKLRELKYELIYKSKSDKNLELFTTKSLPPFNPASNDDVRLLFSRILKRYVKRQTKKGAMSVDKVALSEINTKESRAILAFRECNKILSTYLEPYAKVDEVHSDYNPVATTSGRLASSSPNLQNIPKDLRVIFVARPGYVFVELDVARAEALMFGILSKDKQTLTILKQGDFHRWVASLVFGKSEKEITDIERNIAKTATFAILYMATPMGLVEGLRKKANIKITEKRATQIIEAYKKRLPILSHYQNKCREIVTKNYAIPNAFGRMRRFRILKYLPINAEILKRAVNHTVQSSLSDLFLAFLVFVIRNRHYAEDDVHLVNSVHDSAVFEVKKELLNDFCKWLNEQARLFSKYLRDEAKFVLPIDVKLEIKVGINWGKLEELSEVIVIPANN